MCEGVSLVSLAVTPSHISSCSERTESASLRFGGVFVRRGGFSRPGVDSCSVQGGQARPYATVTPLHLVSCSGRTESASLRFGGVFVRRGGFSRPGVDSCSVQGGQARPYAALHRAVGAALAALVFTPVPSWAGKPAPTLSPNVRAGLL